MFKIVATILLILAAIAALFMLLRKDGPTISSKTVTVEFLQVPSTTDAYCYLSVGGERTDTISVNPGDTIVWENKVEYDATVTFTRKCCTDLSFTVASGARHSTRVESDARGDYEFSYTCKTGGSGGPKVQVGDPP